MCVCTLICNVVLSAARNGIEAVLLNRLLFCLQTEEIYLLLQGYCRLTFQCISVPFITCAADLHPTCLRGRDEGEREEVALVELDRGRVCGGGGHVSVVG